MTSEELREKFLKFFEKNNHAIIPSASLVPSDEEQLEGKEKVLFTSAGMQPLIPYLLGQPHPKGKRLVNVQKCLRTDDINEVGDLTHHTFFEMLGSWSLGDYFKKQAIELSFKFLTEELNIPIEKLAVSVFAGDSDAPRDEESVEIWRSLGIPAERIFYFGKENNWWPTSRIDPQTGEIKNALGPCGPDTEMFYWIGEGEPEGTPNENPNWVEIWNDVFMQYFRKDDGTLEELPQKNVDTGMGLERTLAVLTGKKSAYETDLFAGIIGEIEKALGKKYGDNAEDDKKIRVIADHLRASSFLLGEGVEPSNKERGYVLRRLIRRSITYSYLLNPNYPALLPVIDVSIHKYKIVYPELLKDMEKLSNTFTLEEGKFKKILESALQKIRKEGGKIKPGQLFSGKSAFDLYQNYGIPVELTEEILAEIGLGLDKDGFEEEFKKHQQISKTQEDKRFAGGLAGHSETEIKYHTATHLLHQALRDVLGPTVFQKGSNITEERLRFDFSFDRKMTEEEIKKVENIISQRIREKLAVENKTISLKEAREQNAIGLFDEKYTDKVSVYGIGPGFKIDPDSLDQRLRGNFYSFEFCGGPHVKNTSEVGGIKIVKEEAVSQGIRRIRAELI
ncbi:alanine--tRNA ligase [Candidatus Daviesbacteria bacterium]|nr:alanine--tRNA ligase [Candidatus Daviesbacteria bacterium]